MKVKTRSLSGFTTDEMQAYETQNREVARRAAAEGIVLLHNEGNLLPLSLQEAIALYGSGAVLTVKGGTGSGVVNSRPAVNIWEGLLDAGFKITTTKWLDGYKRAYDVARQEWKEQFWERARSLGITRLRNGSDYLSIAPLVPFVFPCGAIPEKKEASDDAKTAIFVLARTAGEGSDRWADKGDYYLTDEEEVLLQRVCALYEQVVLVLNTGGLIDLDFTNQPEMRNIRAIVYLHQPGMEAGHAFADVISGKVTPSGKLTDTWALSYADYPSSATFSHNNGDVACELYTEGIYVGYRYFDTFEKKVRYGFGYGLSYTTFEIMARDVLITGKGTNQPVVTISFLAENTGSRPGREVVQVYVSCPQDQSEKEFRRLAGFGKTGVLLPQEKEEIRITFPLYALASFDEKLPGWVMEKGAYILEAGNSLETAKAIGVLRPQADLVFTRTQHICQPQRKLEELSQSEEVKEKIAARREALLSEVVREEKPQLILQEGDVVQEVICYDPSYDDTPKEVRSFVDMLDTKQLIRLVTGDVHNIFDESGKEEADIIGNAGTLVPGSAAQTSGCAAAQGLPGIVLADGPAGLRIARAYDVVDGKAQEIPYIVAKEDGFLMRDEDRQEVLIPDAEKRYQFCTAFPVGTVLAQTWDPALIRKVGEAVAKELKIFGVTLWLAPGMNIHRNPLCGRNFEYYSEDPVVSGVCAAAMTEGVQSLTGVGTTIKHFACNNQEDNRMGSDSILSERVLREIYLKGFEIAVKTAQPFSIMTSYNLVNGVHAANSYDLCTMAARNEWGYRGVIMTDWTTTMKDETCTASGCMRAGNDLVMPGARSDHENMIKELEEGTLPLKDLKRSVARLVNIVWRSDFVE